MEGHRSRYAERCIGSFFLAVTVAEEAPKWVWDTVRDIHGEMSLNDTRFEMIFRVGQKLAAVEWPPVAVEELMDELVSDRISDRLQWLTSDASYTRLY